MKVSLFVGSLLLALIATRPAFAQTKADAKLAAQLQKDVTYLASDDMEGRLTGSAGEQKAGDYIVERYTSEHIAPYKGQYRYPFHFVHGKAIDKATRIQIGNQQMRLNQDVFPLPFSKTGRATGDVLPDVMESGNLWLVNLYGDKDEADDPHFDWEKAMYDKAIEAQKQGATAILFYDGYGSKWAPQFNAMSDYEAVEIPAAFVTNDAFVKYIHGDAEERYNNKNGVHIDMNIAIKNTDRTGTNIAAYIDNGATYTVVIGAHYDHLGRGEDGNSLYNGKDNAIHHGADDNASGTAALLAMADMVKRHRLRHYNYLFVNFSGEELGLIGSKNFVKDQHMDSSHIAYMVNMDMVGRLSNDHVLNVGGIGTSPAWSSVTTVPGTNFKFVVDSSGVGPSDHTSFYLQHIPVLFFFTGMHADYHKPSDEAGKINYMGEAQVIDYVYDVVKSMDAQPRPAFTATRQESMGHVNYKVTLGIMPDYSYTSGGVRVDAVTDKKPAKRIGIQPGDIIIQLGDYKINGMQSYMEALSKFEPGDATDVRIKRGDKVMDLPMHFDEKK